MLVFGTFLILLIGVSASPFHKYPFVFLLDVGNEELKKTNTEQIRLSVPGGSIAIRYPAVGDGDTIGHVRVSGIDFGTDLKASILDGGPGYQYVVLVFYGNVGVAYDAVITIQTVPNDALETERPNTKKNYDKNPTVDIENDIEVNKKRRADAAFDALVASPSPTRISEELTQSSSNNYNYAANEADDDEDNVVEDDHNQEEDYSEISDSISKDTDVKDYLEDNNRPESNQESDSTDDGDFESPQAQEYKVNNGFVTEEKYDSDVPISIVDDNLYEKYEALKPHLSTSDVKIYPAGAFNDVKEQYDKDLSPSEEPVDLDQMFNDEIAHNDDSKNSDANSNDFDDGSPVEY